MRIDKYISDPLFKNRYLAMIDRCYNPANPKYKDYGGRGIDVCEEWLESFEAYKNFLISVGYTQDCNLHLDRIDNDKGYSPENCRFVTAKQNMRNRRSCAYYEYQGKIFCLEELFEHPDNRCKNRSLLSKRLRTGWDIETALNTVSDPEMPRYTAFGESKRLFEWAKDNRCVVDLNTLKARVRSKWNFEQALTKIPNKHKLRYTIFNETKALSEWVADPRCKVDLKILQQRIRRGWKLEDTLTK